LVNLRPCEYREIRRTIEAESVVFRLGAALNSER